MRFLPHIVLTLALSACAMHASLDPPTLDAALLYSQVTSCPGKLPAPLPAAEMGPPARSAEPCTEVQVGAKSYTDSISAIGMAVVAVIGGLAMAGLL
jgi:hypothetical protein